MNRATESYTLLCAPPFAPQTLAFGRVLFGGAESDAGRIIDPAEKNQDFDGPAGIWAPSSQDFLMHGDGAHNPVLALPLLSPGLRVLHAESGRRRRAGIAPRRLCPLFLCPW